MKIKNEKVLNGRSTVKLTPDVETNAEIIGQEMVDKLKNFRRKNGYDGVDLSCYEIEVKDKE